MAGPNPDEKRDTDERASEPTRRQSIAEDGLVRWVLTTDDEPVVLVRDLATVVIAVGLFGVLLFGVSGLWPPLVAVESGSMEPNVEVGDLVFITDDDRFVGDDPAGETGVVTLEDGQNHEKFGKGGDVIVFAPGGDEGETPVIHRAHFWVEGGENWVDTRADPAHVNGDSCAEVSNCPAPHDGFVTKGDANAHYDQTGGLASHENSVVRPEWVTGKASFRLPWLGHVRLTLDQLLVVGGSVGAAGIVSTGGAAAGSAIRTDRRL
jgi:signal peptidase I